MYERSSHGTAQDVPDLTLWLYNWALLGGYKERL